MIYILYIFGLIILTIVISIIVVLHQSKSDLNMDVLNNIDLITTLINKGFTNFEFYVEKITTYIKHQPKTQMIKITGTKMMTIRSGTYDYHNSYFGQIVIKCIDIKKKIRIVSKYEYNIENINKIANLKNRINQLNSKKSILN